MRYMLLIYEPAEDVAAPPEPAAIGAYGTFTSSARGAGAFVHGEPLESMTSAKSLRTDGGRVVVTDGPFLETREQLGGFFIVECETAADAREWAAKLPGAATGRVEVRRLAGHDQRLIDAPGKPKFMALIYGDESRYVPFASEEQRAIVSGHQRFTAECIERNEFVTGDGLALSKDARTVAVRDGATFVTDGPFAETREVLAGFYEFACEDIDRAVELASALLFNDNGGVEVRPVMDLGAA